ncbi:MAG: hypothetical protein AAB368_09465 [bacterium]
MPFVLPDPAARRRARLAAGVLVLAALLAALMAAEAQDAARRALVNSWVLQTEELGAFARGALASRDELLLVQRLGALGKRDEIAYVVIQDAQGAARFVGNLADAGRRFESETARRASAATATLLQPIPALNALEIDVPLGALVLRVGFSFRPLAPVARWRWGAVALSAAALAAAGFVIMKKG